MNKMLYEMTLCMVLIAQSISRLDARTAGDLLSRYHVETVLCMGT